MVRGTSRLLLAGIILLLLDCTSKAGTIVGQVRLPDSRMPSQYQRLSERLSAPGAGASAFTNHTECASLQSGLKIAKRGTVQATLLFVDPSSHIQPPVRRRYKPHVIKVGNRGFFPRVLPIITGERVAFLSSLKKTIKITTNSKKRDLSFTLKQRGKRKIINFRRPTQEFLGSPNHPWFRLYIRAFDHPLFAMTSRRGIFRIDGVPPGPQTINYWHEFLGAGAKQIAVPQRGVARIRVIIPLSEQLRAKIKKCTGP